MAQRAIVQVGLERDGALPEDVVTNTMHFEADDGPTFASLTVGLEDRIRSFYQGIGNMLAKTLSGGLQIKIYNWADAKPRVPVVDSVWTMPTGSTALPAEVALCISYAAEASSGQSQARRRGRIFLGPLDKDWAAVLANDIRPNQAFVDNVMGPFLSMATGNGGAFRLAVYSPTTKAAGGSDDAAWNDVTKVWIDNSFDTVRSRGSAPSARTLGVI